jgi:hypothetical protein
LIEVLFIRGKMFTGRQKIQKANGAEPDEFESSIAQELFNLEVKELELLLCLRKQLRVTFLYWILWGLHV